MTTTELERRLLSEIPLARAMALRVAAIDGGCVRLQAPLSANHNDKGCAFGGSLASLMTLASWALALSQLRELAVGAEVFVQDSAIRYLVPVWEDLDVTAALCDAAMLEDYRSTYRRRGRARLDVTAQCQLGDGRIAATLSARFVAIDPARQDPARSSARSPGATVVASGRSG